MPQQPCKVCGQWLGGNNWQKHLLSERHQEGLNQQTRKKNAEQFGIFVTGFFNQSDLNLEKLKELFSQFGEVCNGFLGQNRSYAILEFKCREHALKALNTPVNYKNLTLIVRPRVCKNSSGSAPPTPCPSPAPEKMVVGLEGSWEAQAQRLAALLGIAARPEPPEHDRRLQEVCRAVRKALSPTFYDCTTHVFGSRYTGLARTDSDVDIYVDISKCEYMNNLSPRDQNILQTDPYKFHQNMFSLCCKKLMKCRTFTNILGVSRARTPVIKCIHAATQIQCDLTFKNYLSVCNSQLLRYFFELDPRIKAMVVVLRHWSQLVQIANLSNYALTMMVFFYLRRLPQPMVPSIQAMINAHEEPCYSDSWRCSFTRLFFQTKNTQTLQELLQGFFLFVATFDFGVDVMCSLDAEAVPKWRFLEASTLPPSQQLLSEAMGYDLQLSVRSHLCIQDPFELSHNTTHGMVKQNLADLRNICAAAAKICGEPSRSLDEMFQARPEPPTWTPQSGNLVTVQYNNFFPLLTLLKAGAEITDIWCEQLLDVIQDMFKFVLCFEELGDEASRNKPKKLDFSEEPLTLKLSSKYCLWTSRKQATKDVKTPGSMSMFAREVAITQFMLKTYYKNPLTKSSIVIDVILKVEKAPTRLELKIIDVKSEVGTVIGLTNFLNSTLQTLVDKGLTEDYKKDLLCSQQDVNNEGKKKAVAAKRSIETSQKSQKKEESHRARFNHDVAEETKTSSESELSTMDGLASTADDRFQLVASYTFLPPSAACSMASPPPESEKVTMCSLSSHHEKLINIPKQSPLNFLLKPSEIESLKETAEKTSEVHDEVANPTIINAVNGDANSVISDSTTLTSTKKVEKPSEKLKKVPKRSAFGPKRLLPTKDKSNEKDSLQDEMSPQTSSSLSEQPATLLPTRLPLGTPLRRPKLPHL